jgi:hypothetical protein
MLIARSKVPTPSLNQIYFGSRDFTATVGLMQMMEDVSVDKNIWKDQSIICF